MRPRLFRRAAILTLAATLFALPLSEPAMSDPISPEGPQPHCIGRFDFALPAGLRSGGREQSLYLVRVWSEAADPAADPVEGFGRRTATLRMDPAARELPLPDVGPALLHPPAAPARPGALKLLAMKPAGDHAVFLEAPVSAGRESVAADVVSQIARAYDPAAADGFCIGHGAFRLPPSKNERARTAFAGAEGLSLSVETETVAAPEPAATPDDVAADAAAVASDGGTLVVLLQGDRAVAGLPGRELRVALTDKEALQKGEEPLLVYTWVFPGGRADGLHPRVRLAASAPTARAGALDAAWDTLLGTLRRRPSPE